MQYYENAPDINVDRSHHNERDFESGPEKPCERDVVKKFTQGTRRPEIAVTGEEEATTNIPDFL
ncbi:MAG: hypothetical protein R2757_13485 [Draconibacterium sp.]